MLYVFVQIPGAYLPQPLARHPASRSRPGLTTACPSRHSPAVTAPTCPLR